MAGSGPSSGSGPQRAIVRAVRQLLSPEQLSSDPNNALHPALLPTRGTSLHSALGTLGSWWQIHGPQMGCYLQFVQSYLGALLFN